MNTIPFKPAWWLKNPHAQTVWPTLSGRRTSLQIKKQIVELPDGDFIELVWDQDNAEDRDKPIVLIMHGMGGDIDSPYAKGLMKAMSQHNWRPVFMHLRGASNQPNRLDRAYHSGETEDLAYIVNFLKQQCDVIAAIGISLSGNALLKWLGESGENNPLQAAVAISIPFELDHASTHIMKGFSKVYQYYLLRALRQNLNIKFADRQAPFDLEKMNTLNTFWDFDDHVTAPLHGFEDAHDYYQKSSCRQYLAAIKKPTLIIHASDDPFVPQHAIPTNDELSDSTTLELTTHGGHVGFIAGKRFGVAEYWLEERIPSYFKGKI